MRCLHSADSRTIQERGHWSTVRQGYRLLLQWQIQNAWTGLNGNCFYLSSNTACFLETSSCLVDFHSPSSVYIGCIWCKAFTGLSLSLYTQTSLLFHCYENLLARRLLCSTSKNLQNSFLWIFFTTAPSQLQLQSCQANAILFLTIPCSYT